MHRSRPLYLQEDVRLQGDPAGPLLGRVGEDVVHRLSVGEALALGFLGQSGDAATSASHVSATLGTATGEAWVAHALARWQPYLGGEMPRPFDRALLGGIDWSAYRAPAPLRREAAPASISWLVTLGCNRRCPYCYYKIRPWSPEESESPPDATFSGRRALRMVREMGRIGAAELFLTGGEPLLRHDLTSIIAAAAGEGVRVHVNTKLHITRERAAALADAGLHELSFSLDDARPAIADGMTGTRDFLPQAYGSIHAVLEAGLRLRVNAVATALNRAHLGQLCELLISLGVPRLTISPFVDPGPFRRAPTKLITIAPPIGATVSALQARYGDRLAIDVGTGETFAPAAGALTPERHFCEVGIRSLDVLPDGAVTRCRYLPELRELVVGDLETESLMDVWNGSRLARLSEPEEHAYAGSTCAGCGGFAHCNARGRCVVSAIASHGRWNAPDAACTREVSL